MAKEKKAADTKPIADVAHPGTSAPSDTSKPIINQRPIMKDPMVVEDDDQPEGAVKKPLPAKAAETKITPPEEPKADETKSEAGSEEPAKPETAVDDKAGAAEDADDGQEEKKVSKPGLDTETAAEAAEDAKLQQLIDSKKYFLPINAVEHRRSKRVVIIGVLLALILVVAWVDIALDASLINIDGIKPVTHFFSS